jgi:tetratricopeptide (TPR) repeat protein
VLGVLLLSLAGGFRADVAAHPDHSERWRRLEERIRTEPGNAFLLLERGELHRRAGHFEEALRDYEGASALDPDLAEAAAWCRAALHLDRGELDAALGEIAERDPLTRDQLLLLAEVLERREGPLAAALRLTEVLTRNPGHPAGGHPETYLRIHDLFRSGGGDPRIVRGWLERGLAAVGPAVALEEALCALALEEGEWDEALACLDRMPHLVGAPELRLVRRGEVLAAAGRFLEAAAAYTEALDRLDDAPEPGRRNIERLRQRALAGLAALPEPTATPGPDTRIEGEPQ